MFVYLDWYKSGEQESHNPAAFPIIIEGDKGVKL